MVLSPPGRSSQNALAQFRARPCAERGLKMGREHRADNDMENGCTLKLRQLEDWCGTFPGWFLYYPKQRHTPPSVRAFIDFLRRPKAAPDAAR
jgi:DNA-binding transcriptional LysR family regulator